MSYVQVPQEKLRKGRVAPAHWPRRCVPVPSHSGFTECLEPQQDIKVQRPFQWFSRAVMAHGRFADVRTIVAVATTAQFMFRSFPHMMT